ncbi:MAG: hypothetical protein RL701_6607 [Pseudomonadota bacterium]|jgi:hypothetical protein
MNAIVHRIKNWARKVLGEIATKAEAAPSVGRVRNALVALRAKPSRAPDPIPAEVITGPISRSPGLTCPQCGHRIQITIDLILGGHVVCPSCFLQLSVERDQSREALAALERLNYQLNQARKMMV